jgi:hypothetical protein
VKLSPDEHQAIVAHRSSLRSRPNRTQHQEHVISILDRALEEHEATYEHIRGVAVRAIQKMSNVGLIVEGRISRCIAEELSSAPERTFEEAPVQESSPLTPSITTAVHFQTVCGTCGREDGTIRSVSFRWADETQKVRSAGGTSIALCRSCRGLALKTLQESL